MPYLLPADLKSELGQPQETVVWGQGPFPSESRVEAMIQANSNIIDGKCRGRYTVPFSPVPEDVANICLSLCLGDLLPQVSNRPEQHDRAQRERKWAMERLEMIRQNEYSIEADDAASTLVAGGPIIVSTPATERAYSMEDAY